jgi:hypothetical protein
MPADPSRAVRLALYFRDLALTLRAFGLALRAFALAGFAFAVLTAAGPLFLTACSGSYCGAPCDHPARPAAPADTHVNQYGSLYGYLEVDSLSKAQLNLEKNSLEFLLKANPKDAEILTALKAEGDSAYAFRYEDYSTGGDRFDVSGKLRRKAAMEAGAGRIARLIGESQGRELFERYRQVRWRIIQREKTEALVPPPAPLPDTTWTGSYRAGSGALEAAPAKFPSADSCQRWGAREAEAHRDKAFAFEYECRQGSVVVKRKAW